MPNVDGKQFGYGPKGKKAAKAYAKKMGKKVSKKKNPGYYVESFASSLKERIDALFEGRRAHRGHRDVAGRRLSKPTPTKRTPEEAAAAAEKGEAAHNKRRAKFEAHVKAANEKNREEREKK